VHHVYTLAKFATDELNFHDPKDPTSLPPSARKRLRARGTGRPKSLRIGIPLDYNIDTLEPAVRKNWIARLRHLWDRGHTLHPVRLPTTQQALSAYYVLAPAEASSNLAKYDGVRFGSRAEGIDGTPDSVLFAKTRGQCFGSEVQRRILLGAFSLSAQAIDNYFIQAQKVRRLVQQDFNNVFATPNPLFDHDTNTVDGKEKVDILLCPTVPSRAPSLSEVEFQDPIHSYMNDVFTVPASLAGLPAITVPSAAPYDGSPGKRDPFYSTVGLQIIGQYGDDHLVLDAAKLLESIAGTPQTRGGPEVTAWGLNLFDDNEVTAPDKTRYGPRAMELDVSIEEAKAIESAEARAKAIENAASLKKVLGMEHLTAAAELSGRTVDEYLAKFTARFDFVRAESMYHDSVMRGAAKRATYAEKQKLARLRIVLAEKLGENRLTEAARLHQMTILEYVATFLNDDDPVAAEGSAYESAKYMAEKRGDRVDERR
jgi:aspartyl-tRNA(Asn)/glutamyl-tRNA(Gln) amidotransferase subunit A